VDGHRRVQVLAHDQVGHHRGGRLADGAALARDLEVGVGVADVVVGQSGVSVSDPSYLFLLGSLFVMGLGMGCTMMPIMSSALATLKD